VHATTSKFVPIPSESRTDAGLPHQHTVTVPQCRHSSTVISRRRDDVTGCSGCKLSCQKYRKPRQLLMQFLRINWATLEPTNHFCRASTTDRRPIFAWNGDGELERVACVLISQVGGVVDCRSGSFICEPRPVSAGVDRRPPSENNHFSGRPRVDKLSC